MTGISPYSGRAEERSLLNGANKRAAEAIEGIGASLPFPLTGGHYDNGTEFINKPLLEWRLARYIKAGGTGPAIKTAITKELRCGAKGGGVFPV